MEFKLALGGDAIINRRISNCGDPDVNAIFDLYRSADLGILNCETLIHNYVGDGIYPSAEAGWGFMRSPKYVAEELHWLNTRLVGTANNHSLDYSYGGLFSTHQALEAAGIEFAGTGRDLAAARAPAYIDTPNARVGLVSMTASATLASRASNSHDGIPGRPGVNPLGWHFAGDKQTIARMVELATGFGWWIARVSEREWQFNPPGLHHTITRYFEVDKPGAGMIVDEEDATENLRAIKSARSRADLVVAHIHNHEWDPSTNLTTVPPAFICEFSRGAIDAGADVVLVQGCHAPIRGIELHQGKPIFYDSGDLFGHHNQVARYPGEFYRRHNLHKLKPMNELLPIDAVETRFKFQRDYMINPKGGYQNGRGRFGVVPVLEYDGLKLRSIKLHPFVHDHHSAAQTGMPIRPASAGGSKIISDIAALSAPFGTAVRDENAIGVVQLARN